MAEASICKQCSAPMQLQSIGTVAGEDGVLKISVSDFPALVCERGHRQFVARDFPVKLLENVAASDKTGLPAGKKQGLLFKKYHCGRCGEPLGAEAEARPFGFDVNLADAPQMRVEFTVPVYKCTACGEQQLRDRAEIEALVPAALAHGFQAAGFKPQA
jgi:ribosomal protein L34E